MPELPEVETTCRGIRPHLVGRCIETVRRHHTQLRWPIPTELVTQVKGQAVNGVTRRGKYILLSLNSGTVIIHLGMSGTLSLVPAERPSLKHDHVEFLLSDQMILRFNDPRRFGAVLWTQEDVSQHALLTRLGPEPLEKAFNANALFERARTRKTAIKSLIMDSHIVVGVGNIYAQEALFMAGIHPLTEARQVSLSACKRLVAAIKQTLRQAIKLGGTTLKDFVDPTGKPGYFRLQLAVYGRGGAPCVHCESHLERIKIQQRTTVFCPVCQTMPNG